MTTKTTTTNRIDPARSTSNRDHPQTDSMKQQASSAAKELGEQATETAKAAKQRIAQRGQEAAQQQKHHAAHECEVFGSAVREAGHKLEEEGHEKVACYAEACADELDRAAGYLRDRDFGGLYEDASCFARKHPELFLGGMFLAGAAVARLVKASTRKARNMEFSEEHVSPDYGSSATADTVNPYTQIEPSSTAPGVTGLPGTR